MGKSLAIASSIIMLSGCMTSHRLGPGERVSPNARVAITFDSPRHLETRSDATVYAHPEVRRVRGRVVEVRSDTIVLRDLWLESTVRRSALPRDERLALPSDALGGLTIRRVSKARTGGLVIVLLAGAFVGLIANAGPISY